MTAWLFYVDESFDDEKFCLTGMGIRHRDWKRCFEQVKTYRTKLRQDFGIHTREEIHAYKLVAGRGQLSANVIGKWERSRIFYGMLQIVSQLPVKLINVCLNVSDHDDAQLVAWDRLVNRIERTMKAFEDEERQKRGKLYTAAHARMSKEDAEAIQARLSSFSPKAMIISDEGRDAAIISALRGKHVHNPVPSKFGQWPTGHYTKSITIDNIIEDPIFRKSSTSYFLQLVDCVCYALLKRETKPTPHAKKYKIDKMFEKTLSNVCFRPASPADPLGVVRK